MKKQDEQHLTPHQHFERRIRHQFGLSRSAARVISELRYREGI
ncbi:hypothetical protein [Rhodalgimonas zhirmunskyi]|nr:hypothetical protein [Rhodoalgimonas zhirmunskyi]